MAVRKWLELIDSVMRNAAELPVLGMVDLTVSEYGDGWVELAWRPSSRWLNAATDRVVFGGAAACALEAAYGLALATVIEDEERPAGLRVQTDFIRPVIVDVDYSILGHVTERRREVSFVSAEITDGTGKRFVAGSGVVHISRDG